MKYIRKRYEIQGLGIERLLDGLQNAGITLYDVRRVRAHCVHFSIPFEQCEQAESFLSSHGFSCKELPETGWARRLGQIRKRWFLLPLAGMAAAALVFALQFIWQIEVSGAGVYRGEVLQFLKEENIHPGIQKREIDLRSLSDGLLYRLPQIAWATAEIRGITLQIRIVSGIPAPDLSANIGGQPCDIVAACDGIVERIDVYAGTAEVKPGETVKKGQVLIKGQEKTGAEAWRGVPARGRVLAHTWLHAQAAVSAAETRSTPTGRISAKNTLCTPWFSYSDQPDPEYLTCDAEVRAMPIGGAWVPLWLERKTYTEVALERYIRPTADLQEESGLAALQKIYSLCGNKDEIIDKNIIFSMIEGEAVIADAYAELLTDIGRAVPQTLK